MRAMEQFRKQYAAPRALPHTGYDRWVAKANNAALGAFAAYDQWVPAFEALFAHQAKGNASGAAWPPFLMPCASSQRCPNPSAPKPCAR